MRMKEIRNKNGETLPVISKGKALSIVAKLKESIEAKTFVEMALDDNEVLRLLCSHRSSLSAFEKYNFPMLFSIKRWIKVKSDLPFTLVATKETAKSQHRIEQIIERAKPTLEELSKNFMKKHATLLEDINIEAESLVYQEEREQQILGMIVSQIIVQDLADEEKILKIIKMFEDFVIDDVAPVGLMFVNSLKKEFVEFGVKNREKIMHSSKLDESRYEDTIKKLEIEYSAIKPLISVFWCENKRHEHHSFFMISHFSVPDIKCPICGKKLSVGTFYYFIPPINYLLRSREGLIQALTIHIIDKTEREWLPGVYLEGIGDDTEKDIVIRKNDDQCSIVEIKSFATDVSTRTKKEHLKQLLNQSLKHLDSYLKRNIIVNDLYLISNYWVDDEIVELIDDLLSQKKFSKLKEVNLEIIGPNNIKKLKVLEDASMG